jgi:hypothetical protein
MHPLGTAALEKRILQSVAGHPGDRNQQPFGFQLIDHGVWRRLARGFD